MATPPFNDSTTRQGRSPVMIKGSRDGLTFIFQEELPFNVILNSLRDKLTGEGAQLFVGPTIGVHLSLGGRVLSEEDLLALKEVLALRDNLSLKEIPQENLDEGAKSGNPIGFLSQLNSQGGNLAPARVHYGTVRSGVRIEHLGDIVVVGDVNPGGQLIASGDILVMGALRGMAHAGYLGDEFSIIAAVYFNPTQLRIANVISRSPDSDSLGPRTTEMEFAYLREGQMAVDKLAHLSQIRVQ